MHGLIRQERAPIQRFIKPLRRFPLEQEEFINVEMLHQLEFSELENEINDYFTILEYINKINSGWFNSYLEIDNEDIREWLHSDLDSYRFFKEFSEYLSQISESYGVVIPNIKLEKAEYEYPQESSDEIVIVLNVPDSIESNDFVKLWLQLSQESYNFIKEDNKHSKDLYNKSILVLRRVGNDE
jgi:hypothetical protein